MLERHRTPDGAVLQRQLLAATPWNQHQRFLIRDRDRSYGGDRDRHGLDPDPRSESQRDRRGPSRPPAAVALQSAGESGHLMPIFNDEFLDEPGTGAVTVFTPDDEPPYVLAFYWIDAVRTIFDITQNNWQFVSSGGQGQAEIDGVFLISHPDLGPTTGRHERRR